jgi:restriction endonuclease S subunit
MQNEFKTFRIGDIATVIGGGTPSTSDSDNYGGDISWITPKDLSKHKSRYISHGERSITNKGLKDSSATLLPKNSILFSSRAPIGYIAIAKKEDEELIKSFISEFRDSKAVFANWQNQDNPKNNLYSKIYKLESGFENNQISREKIVKLLEFGLDVKHECSNNADLDKLIER